MMPLTYSADTLSTRDMQQRASVLLQRVGLEEDKFASSTGAMRGLELA